MMSDAKDGSQANRTDDPTRWGAAEIARRLADGVCSSAEVVDAFIARIESLQPSLRMVTHERFEQARREAIAADKRRASDEALPPLNGVPISVKECFHVAGLPTNLGVTGRNERAASQDAALVSRLRAAGAIVLAKTNLSQLGLYLESDNPRFGRTNNPWNESMTCGGSSGGEAVMAAIRGSALGVASDLGGSIRLPAHFCGVHGFKPTSGLLPDGGIQFGLPGMKAIANVPGFIGRSIEDLALAMNVGQLGSIESERRYRSRKGEELEGVRIGVCEADGFFPVSPAIRRVVQEAANHLRSRGAELVELPLPSLERLMTIVFGVLAADGGAAVRRQLVGSKVDERLTSMLWLSMMPGIVRRVAANTLRRRNNPHKALLVESARKRTTDEYWQLSLELDRYRCQFVDVSREEKLELMLLPPAALPAFPHGNANELVTAAAYSMFANVLDFPAGVVAASRVREGEAPGKIHRLVL